LVIFHPSAKEEIIMKFSSSLKLNHIFRRLYATKGFANGFFVLYARKNRTASNRLGITVSKKLGKAHIRNRARRRIREIYRLNELSFLPGYDIVVVARSRCVDAPFDQLTKGFLALARKAGILNADEPYM
jgi:ribonuclease P protein component